MEVRIKKSAYLDMGAELALYPDTETGGVWLGTLREDHWLITHNLRPGPKALHEPGCFAYDHEHVLTQAAHIAASQQPLSVIGYWHSHTSGRDTPSPGDAQLDEQYAALRSDGALCGIVTNRDGFCLSVYQVGLPLRYEKMNFIITEE